MPRLRKQCDVCRRFDCKNTDCAPPLLCKKCKHELPIKRDRTDDNRLRGDLIVCLNCHPPLAEKPKRKFALKGKKLEEVGQESLLGGAGEIKI